jgi:isopentenyldiphosphate isomerase
MNNHHIANKPDELLDWVDQDDQVIGQIVRGKANSDPQYTHREVGVLIFDKDNRVLLQRRSQYKTVHPGMWSVTAGHILSGETAIETAHTELKEELGFDTDLEYLEKEFHSYDHETHFMYYYLAKYEDQEIELEAAEVEKVQFFSRSELDNLLKSEELVNKKHLPIINKVLDGKFK